MRSDVETVRVDDPVPFDVSVTLLGASDAVGGTTVMSDVDETDAITLTVPENPLRLLKISVELPEDPTDRLRELGEAVMVKSGTGPENLHAVSACSSQCPSGSQ